MADVTDSKSVGSNTVWVQVPLPAPGKGLEPISAPSPFAFLLSVARIFKRYNIVAYRSGKGPEPISAPSPFAFLLSVARIFKRHDIVDCLQAVPGVNQRSEPFCFFIVSHTLFKRHDIVDCLQARARSQSALWAFFVNRKTDTAKKAMSVP